MRRRIRQREQDFLFDQRQQLKSAVGLNRIEVILLKIFVGQWLPLRHQQKPPRSRHRPEQRLKTPLALQYELATRLDEEK